MCNCSAAITATIIEGNKWIKIKKKKKYNDNEAATKKNKETKRRFSKMEMYNKHNDKNKQTNKQKKNGDTKKHGTTQLQHRRMKIRRKHDQPNQHRHS